MYEEDYILRIATQAVRALMRLLGLKRAGQYRQALELLDQTLQEEVGPSAALVDQLSASELVAMLRFGEALDHDKALLLAALLKEQGDLLAAENRMPESGRAYTKGLQVALEALREADEALCRKHLPLVETLTDRLGRPAMDSDTRYGLFEYYQKLGDPVKAKSYFSSLLS